MLWYVVSPSADAELNLRKTNVHFALYSAEIAAADMVSGRVDLRAEGEVCAEPDPGTLTLTSLFLFAFLLSSRVILHFLFYL